MSRTPLLDRIARVGEARTEHALTHSVCRVGTSPLTRPCTDPCHRSPFTRAALAGKLPAKVLS